MSGLSHFMWRRMCRDYIVLYCVYVQCEQQRQHFNLNKATTKTIFLAFNISSYSVGNIDCRRRLSAYIMCNGNSSIHIIIIMLCMVMMTLSVLDRSLGSSCASKTQAKHASRQSWSLWWSVVCYIMANIFFNLSGCSVLRDDSLAINHRCADNTPQEYYISMGLVWYCRLLCQNDAYTLQDSFGCTQLI